MMIPHSFFNSPLTSYFICYSKILHPDMLKQLCKMVHKIVIPSFLPCRRSKKYAIKEPFCFRIS